MIRGTGKSPGRLFADGRIQFRGRSPPWATITPDNTHFLPTPLRREGATVGVYDGWLQLFDFFGLDPDVERGAAQRARLFYGRTIRCSADCTRETLIKLSLSTANAATVSADEAEDTGNDEWIRALQQKDAAGIVFGRDGAGGALGQAMRADRALLPDGG